MADKTKDAQDTALSALLSLPTLLGIVKAAPTVVDALSQFSTYLNKNTTESVNSVLNSFLEQSADAPYVRTADTSMVKAAQKAIESTKQQLVHEQRQRLGVSNAEIADGTKSKWRAISQAISNNPSRKGYGTTIISGEGVSSSIEINNLYDMMANGFSSANHPIAPFRRPDQAAPGTAFLNKMDKHFPGSQAQYGTVGSIRPAAALAFVQAHQRGYGYGPTNQIRLGNYSEAAVEEHLGELAGELDNVHKAALLGDQRAQRVMRDTYKNLQKSVSPTEQRVTSFSADIQVRLEKTKSISLQSSANIETWLRVGTEGSSAARVRDLASKTLYGRIGHPELYTQLNDPVYRSAKIGDQLNRYRAILQEVKASSAGATGPEMEAIDAIEKTIRAQNSKMRNMQLEIAGITYDNGGLTQQALEFTISSNGKNKSMHLQPISWMVPVTTQGYISRGPGAIPDVTILNHAGLYGSNARNLKDAGDMALMDNAKMFGKLLNDIRDNRMSEEEIRRVVSRASSKSTAYTVPRTYTAKDVMNRTMVQFDEHDFYLNRQSKDNFRRVIEGSKGIDLLRTGGDAILYDTEYGSGLSRRTATPQEVTRSLATETYEHGLLYMDTAADRLLAAPEPGSLNAVPTGSQARHNMEMWLRTHGTSASEVVEWKRKARLNGSTGKVARRAIALMGKWEEEYLHRDGRSRQSFFFTQEGPAFDVPILRNTLQQLSANGIGERELRKEFGPLYDRLFAGINNRHAVADVLSDSYRHANAMSIFRVLNPKQPVSEGAQSMFTFYYGMSTLELEKTVGMATSETAWKDKTIINRVFGKKGPTPKQLESVKYILKTIRDDNLVGKTGPIHGHAAQFDVTMLRYILTGMQKQVGNLSAKELAGINTVATRAETLYQRSSASWTSGPNFIQSNRDRFDPYAPQTASGALSVSLTSTSKTQASRLKGTLLHLEKVLPLGALNNFGREKYQFAAGRVLNPMAGSNTYKGKKLTTAVGYGQLQTTAAAIELEFETLANTLGNDAPPELLRAMEEMTADKEAGNLNLPKLFAKMNAIKSRVGHTSVITMIDYLPEGFAYTEESGSIIQDQLLPYFASYAKESKHTTYFNTKYTAAQIGTDEGMAKFLSKLKFHKGIQYEINKKLSDKTLAISQPVAGKFSLELMGMHGAFDEAQRFVENSGTPPPSAVLAGEALVTSDTSGLGSLYAFGPEYDHQVPGFPSKITIDTNTGEISIGLHHVELDSLGGKTQTDGKVTKQSNTGLSGRVMGTLGNPKYTRGYTLDPFVGAAQGGKYGGSRNETAAALLKQVDRISTKWVMYDNLSIVEQERRANKIWTDLLGDKAADIDFSHTTITTPNGDRPILVTILPDRAEMAVKQNYKLGKLEEILRREGLTYDYVQRRFKENIDRLKLSDPGGRWTAAITQLNQSLERDINTSKAGSTEYANLVRVQANIGNPNEAAPLDLVSLVHGMGKSAQHWGLRALGTRSTSSSVADFWIKFSRAETLSGFPNITPRLLGTTANILLQSFDLATRTKKGGAGPADFNVMAGFLSGQAGVNHVNMWNENAIGDTLLDTQLLNEFYLNKRGVIPDTLDIKGLPNPKKIGITSASVLDVTEELEILGSLQKHVDFDDPNFHSMGRNERSHYLQGKFGKKPSDDFLHNLQLAKDQRETVWYADREWLHRAKLLKPRGPGGNRFIRYDAPTLTQLSKGFDIHGGGSWQTQIARALDSNGADSIKAVGYNGKTVILDSLKKRLIDAKLIDGNGRLQFEFDVKDLLESQIEKLGSNTGGDAAKHKELLQALLRQVDEASVTKDHFVLPSIGGVQAPYASGDRVLFSGLMKDTQGTLQAFGKLDSMRIDLTMDTATSKYRKYRKGKGGIHEAAIIDMGIDSVVADIKRNAMEVSGRVMNTWTKIGTAGFQQANFRAAAGTTTMAWGKLQNSMTLVPALEQVYSKIGTSDFVNTSYALPDFLNVSDKSPFKLDTWLSNLSKGNKVFAPQGGTGRDLVLQTKGFGLGESPISYQSAVDLLQELKQTGQLGVSDEAAAGWLRGETGRRMGRNRSPDAVQGQVLIGQLYVQPDELWKAADSLGAPYVSNSAVYVDRVAMKFMRGDQDGDLAALLNMGGFIDSETGQIGPKGSASRNLTGGISVSEATEKMALAHSSYLAKWEELERRRKGIGRAAPGDVYFAGTVNQDGRELFLHKDPTKHLTMTASLRETLPEGLLSDVIQIDDPVQTSVQHLTQKSFTPIIGGYVKGAIAMAYGGRLGLLNRLEDEIAGSPGAFDTLLEKNNLGGIYGRTLTSGAYLKSMGTLNTVHPNLLNQTGHELVGNAMSAMMQEGGITKINTNPVAGLVTLMSHMRNIKTAMGTPQFDEATKFLAYMDDHPDFEGMSILHQLRDRPASQYSQVENVQLRQTAYELANAYGIATNTLEATAKINQAQFLETIGEKKNKGKIAEMLDTIHTSRFIGDMDRQAASGPTSEIQSLVAGNDGFTTAFRSTLTHSMRSLGMHNNTTENLVAGMMGGIGSTTTMRMRSAGRIMTETLKENVGRLFNFIDSSTVRKLSGRIGTVAAALTFFDPNTGSMMIGEGEGRGGEYSDIPSGKEVMRAFKNRKTVRTKEANPFLQDKLARLSFANPRNERRTVRGQLVPEAPKYEYNNHTRKFNKFNISDHLRRAGAIMQ